MEGDWPIILRKILIAVDVNTLFQQFSLLRIGLLQELMRKPMNPMRGP